MLTTTVTVPLAEAPSIGRTYTFEVGSVSYVGIVRGVKQFSRRHAHITIELTEEEHQRLLLGSDPA